MTEMNRQALPVQPQLTLQQSRDASALTGRRYSLRRRIIMTMMMMSRIKMIVPTEMYMIYSFVGT